MSLSRGAGLGSIGLSNGSPNLGGSGTEDGSDPTTRFAPGANSAWDFINNYARFKDVYYGPLANTPGWSFTRASTGYAQTAAGVLTPFATGTLRRTDKGVLIEGARTNRCLYARDLTNAAWTKTNCTAALDQTGADGVATSASSLLATGANATCLQAITNASVARNFSFWVVRLVGTGNIDITLDNGSTWTTVATTAAYTRVTATQTLANPTVGIRIVTSGDKIAVDFCQEETGAFPSSPIPTTSAAASRAADVLTVPVSGLTYPISLFCEFERAVDTGATEVWFAHNAGGTERVEMVTDTSNRASVFQVAGGVLVAAPNVTGALAVGTVYKVAARVGLNSVQIARGGTLGTEDTSAAAPTTPTTITFGERNGANDFCFGYLRRAAIFPRALSDAELQSIST